MAAVKGRNADLQAAVDGFLKIVMADIQARVKVDKIGLWQNALPLCIHSDWLYAELRKDMEALWGKKRSGKKRVRPRQALARKMRLFFEKNRREHVAAELGVSSNMVKTWERLDRISRRISQDQDGSRCNEDHFAELAGFVKKNHGHDKNLPRKTATIRGYFFRFSDECLEYIDAKEDTMDRLSLNEAKELLSGVGIAELSRCLYQMPEHLVELLDAAFQLGICRTTYLSLNAYLQQKQLSHDDFMKQKDDAMDMLRQCLELALVSRQRG